MLQELAELERAVKAAHTNEAQLAALEREHAALAGRLALDRPRGAMLAAVVAFAGAREALEHLRAVVRDEAADVRALLARHPVTQVDLEAARAARRGALPAWSAAWVVTAAGRASAAPGG